MPPLFGYRICLYSISYWNDSILTTTNAMYTFLPLSIMIKMQIQSEVRTLCFQKTTILFKI